MTLQIDFRNKNNHMIRRTSVTELSAPAVINIKMDEDNKLDFISYDNNTKNALDLLSENEEIYRININNSIIWALGQHISSYFNGTYY